MYRFGRNVLTLSGAFALAVSLMFTHGMLAQGQGGEPGRVAEAAKVARRDQPGLPRRRARRLPSTLRAHGFR